MRILQTIIGGSLLSSLAFGANFTWDGGATLGSAFNNQINWVGDSSFPGASAGDSATIASAQDSNPVVLNNNLSNALSSLTLNAATPNTADIGVQVTATQTQSSALGAVSMTGNGSYTAYLDVDQNASASAVTAAAGLVEFDVASSKTFSINGAFTATADAQVSKIGSGVVTSASFVLDNSAGASSIVVVVTSGSITTN